MKILKLSLLVLALICALVVAAEASRSGGEDGRQRIDLKLNELSSRDRLLLLLAIKLNPRTFEKIPEHLHSELLSYNYLPFIDAFFVDGRQLFTLVKKENENSNLPEFNWGYTYDFCYFFCFNTRLEFSTKDTKFVGTDTISSTTHVTPTSIHNTFKVDSFNWTSPGFLFNITDYDYEEFYLYRNTYYSFENVTIGIDSDYHFVPDVGVQLENLTIYFYAGKIRGGMSDYSVWSFGGELLDSQYYDPEQNEISEEMMRAWNSNKREYTPGIQFGLNCFLSNGRSDSKCNQDSTMGSEYHTLLHLQLIQTIGLGSLLAN